MSKQDELLAVPLSSGPVTPVRDPRVDPRPGDVLKRFRGNSLCRYVTGSNPARVWYNYYAHGVEYSLSAKAWRKWAASAESGPHRLNRTSAAAGRWMRKQRGWWSMTQEQLKTLREALERIRRTPALPWQFNWATIQRLSTEALNMLSRLEAEQNRAYPVGCCTSCAVMHPEFHGHKAGCPQDLTAAPGSSTSEPTPPVECPKDCGAGAVEEAK